MHRRTGVRSHGSYWGAAGEQIDLLSGNLNFTVPLVKALGRGLAATFALNYNSQTWRKDSGGTWNLGSDTGYGRGWRLMAGTITPVWSGIWNLHHFIYTDATGAEYRLDQNNGGVWTSKEATYVSFDQSSYILYFPDGTKWGMFEQSAGEEEDAGTLYPYIMQDTNGNLLAIEYDAGYGTGLTNTSGRIKTIYDLRAAGYGPSFTFTYNNDPIPHLTSITNIVGTGEAYTFGYQANQTLYSPFEANTAVGVATLLTSVTTTGLNVATSFQYNGGTGEMTQMTTPIGGNLYWSYRTYTYAGNRNYREILTRQMTPGGGVAANTWNLTLDNASNLHTTATLADVGAGTSKVWTFGSTGLPVSYEERETTSVALLRKEYTWVNDSTGRPYVSEVITRLNPGATGAAKTKSTQSLDGYGNITTSAVYDYIADSSSFGGTAARTYTFTYLHESDSNYLTRYIRNRVLTVSGSVSVTNHYDGSGGSQYTCATQEKPMLKDYGTIFPPVFYHDRDNFGTGLTYRGNLTHSITPGGTECTEYLISGVPYRKVDGAGREVNITASASTNWSLPGVVTPNTETNLSTSISYASSFAPTNITGPNGASSTTSYDLYGRPAGGTSPDGQTTTVEYTYNPNTAKTTIGTGTDARWSKTTLDGFGRTIKQETGHGTTTVSVVDTEYGWCACAPLGKVKRVSQPHAPGATAVWTTNTYDGSGRTLTVTAADGSVTTYLYQGNTTKVTDPAGKWKKQTTDAMGNLITVTEPNPAGGSDYVTSYTYNLVNQLTSVSMPRNGYTQTRIFNYTGTDLTSETNPETGTKYYVYDADHHVTKRTDAKNQETRYTYDTYGRLKEVHHWAGSPLAERVNENVYYDYDYDYITASYTNSWGRLTRVSFKNERAGANEAFSYLYSYNQPGRVTKQRLSLAGQMNLDATYTWDNEGRMTGMTNPQGNATNGDPSPPTYTYGFDAMGRLNALTGIIPNTSTTGTLASASYGIAGEMTNWGTCWTTTLCYSESRTYNNMFQLLRMQGVTGVTPSTVMDIEYFYNTTGSNNGRIYRQLDRVTGEDVNYSYDPLNRLASATATGGATWSQSYSYDGFGNLGGAGLFDPATNRPYGQSFDANGNPATGTFDVENRSMIAAAGGLSGNVSYDHAGKRVWWESGAPPNGGNSTCEIYFYGITGQRLATYSCGYTWHEGTGHVFSWSIKNRNMYFAGRPASLAGVPVATDRLGSVRWNGSGERFNYYPYGDERGTTAQGREKFGTYFRDADGVDYADQRYYSSGTGRFTTPDPYMNSAGLGDPGSWNLYAYLPNDPINAHDPSGLGCHWVEIPYELPIRICDGPGGGGGGGGGGPQPPNLMIPSDYENISPGGGGVATSDPEPAVSWADTRRSLRSATGKIATATYSDQCVNDIHSLKKSDGSELRVSDVRSLANMEDFRDATTASAQATLMLPNGTTATGPISSFFDPKSPNYVSGLYAFTPFSDSVSYWAPADTSGTDPNRLAGTVMHELLHSLGFTDTAIQSAFTLSVTASDTDNISRKLATDCFGWRP